MLKLRTESLDSTVSFHARVEGNWLTLAWPKNRKPADWQKAILKDWSAN